MYLRIMALIDFAAVCSGFPERRNASFPFGRDEQKQSHSAKVCQTFSGARKRITDSPNSACHRHPRPTLSDMARKQESNAVDAQFYQPAEAFFSAHSRLALTYDDVTLATLYSEILPRDTQLDSRLAEGLNLNIPVISADMDTVTEARMAIAMALNGGLGLIHYNMPEKQQLSELSRVKNHVHGLIQDPIKVAPEQLIGEVLEMIEKRKFAFGTFPVVDADGRLVGLLSGHVVKPRYAKRKVAEALTPRNQVHTTKHP